MLRSKRRTFEGYCPNCRAVKKLTRIGESKELAILWLRCKSCSDTHYYPVKRIHKTGRVLTMGEFNTITTPMPEVVEYSLDKTYGIGQEIHHSMFHDTGKIVKKRETEGRHHVIVVKFEHEGTKNLVEGFESC